MTISVEDLSIGYASATPVAEDINLSLQKGRLVGVVGANGVGKSTLLKTLCNMLPSLGGNISIEGKPLSELSIQALAKSFSVVLTGPPVSKNLTVYELVSLGRQPYTNWADTLSKNDREHIQSALKITETETFAKTKCHQLSDGQLQRVMIARALAQNTPLIILDEPTTFLDIHYRISILKLLKDLTTTGKTVLFSTHEIELAIQLCDEMIVMGGKKTWVDTPQGLIKKNRFSGLFPEDTVRFDPEGLKFKIQR